MISKIRVTYIWCVVVLALLPKPVFAYHYPDLDWKTFETDHFVIHYYDAVEWTARKVSEVAEEIYPRVTAIYNREPKGKTHLVVRDDEDTSNGFAVYNLGLITIWASPSTLPLRGRHDWIRGVLTHEFSHIVSLQASSGAGWHVEGLRLGGVKNSDIRDNLDVGGSVFVSTNTVPRWWAEGTAQLDTSSVGYDPWDTGRDMLLRAATLEDNLLTFDEMRNIVVREHFGGELVYNQGFSFLSWLKEKYGDFANATLAKDQARKWNLDFDRTFKQSLGKDAKSLYLDWKKELKEKYENQVSTIRSRKVEGERIPLVSHKKLSEVDVKDRPYKDGIFNLYPRFSPSGRWFSWIDRSTLKLRYLDHPYIMVPPTESTSDAPEPLTLEFSASSYSWAPDSRQLVLSKRTPTLLNGYPYFDLYILDIGQLSDHRNQYVVDFEKTKDVNERKKLTKRYHSKKASLRLKPRRVTHKARAIQPSWSPDGKWITFSQNNDGHRNLKLIRPDGSEVKDLLAIGGDAEATEPQWSPDGKQIVFTLFNHDQADIWRIDAEGGKPTAITFDSADDRNPMFTADGKDIVFSSDRTGTFQIYRMPAQGGSATQITQVETGAFMPFVSLQNRALIYSRFSSYGFKPYRLTLVSSLNEKSPNPQGVPSETETKDTSLTAERFDPPLQGSKYHFWPRPIRLFPTFVFENDQFMAGIALQASDYLEKHNLTASALFGEDQDYQVLYENRMWVPILSGSYTTYIRNYATPLVDDGDAIADEPNTIRRDNITFIDGGISQELKAEHGFPGTHRLSLFYTRRHVHRRFGVAVIINDQPETSLSLLTNNGGTFRWTFLKQPSLLKRDADINPQNETEAMVAYSFVHTSLGVPDTTISAPNQNYYHHEIMASLAHYYPLPIQHHTLWFKINAGYQSRDVNINDEFFLGGRLNFRAFGQISSNTLFYGYEDFSVSGETLLLLSLGYTFPIFRSIDKKQSIFYWDSIYGVLFTDVGNAWDYGEFKNLTQGATLLNDVGAEIRLKAFMFNDFNKWNSVARVAYGLQDNTSHGFSNADSPMRFYVGLGTEF